MISAISVFTIEINEQYLAQSRYPDFFEKEFIVTRWDHQNKIQTSNVQNMIQIKILIGYKWQPFAAWRKLIPMKICRAKYSDILKKSVSEIIDIMCVLE